eukprot:Selendium_serpulae@DN5135_c0_g1_i1.p2
MTLEKMDALDRSNYVSTTYDYIMRTGSGDNINMKILKQPNNVWTNLRNKHNDKNIGMDGNGHIKTDKNADGGGNSDTAWQIVRVFHNSPELLQVTEEVFGA